MECTNFTKYGVSISYSDGEDQKKGQGDWEGVWNREASPRSSTCSTIEDTEVRTSVLFFPQKKEVI